MYKYIQSLVTYISSFYKKKKEPKLWEGKDLGKLVTKWLSHKVVKPMYIDVIPESNIEEILVHKNAMYRFYTSEKFETLKDAKAVIGKDAYLCDRTNMIYTKPKKNTRLIGKISDVRRNKINDLVYHVVLYKTWPAPLKHTTTEEINAIACKKEPIKTNNKNNIYTDPIVK